MTVLTFFMKNVKLFFLMLLIFGRLQRKSPILADRFLPLFNPRITESLKQ